jgi:hypothetical protein
MSKQVREGPGIWRDDSAFAYPHHRLPGMNIEICDSGKPRALGLIKTTLMMAIRVMA